METVGVYPLVPLPGRQIPAESQRKTSSPLGTNTLTQFEYPAQPVLKKLPLGQGVAHMCLERPAKPLQKAKEKPPHFREWLLVEVTGLEPVTLCRLVHDEPGCKKAKKKHSSYNECLMVEVTGLEPVTLCRLVHDEPSCNREKEKALTFVSA